MSGVSSDNIPCNKPAKAPPITADKLSSLVVASPNIEFKAEVVNIKPCTSSGNHPPGVVNVIFPIDALLSTRTFTNASLTIFVLSSSLLSVFMF